jgi:hypothetical protein
MTSTSIWRMPNIDMHHAQQAALHVPPDVMDIDSDEEPEEIEGVCDLVSS